MSQSKEEAYDQCAARISQLCKGEKDLIARMASVVAVLYHGMPDFYWTGFYRVVEDELVIGPYQGTVGCLRILPNRGVCGAAYSGNRSQVVKDVHQFPGHIACDAASRSEIVIPVHDGQGSVIAVLDVDSTRVGQFDETDRRRLEAIVASVFAEVSRPKAR